jgi:hypothetical protein
MQTDQIWGVVRPQPALDGAVTAVGVLAAALVDAVSGFSPKARCRCRLVSLLQVRCSRATCRDAPGRSGRARHVRRMSISSILDGWQILEL